MHNRSIISIALIGITIVLLHAEMAFGRGASGGRGGGGRSSSGRSSSRSSSRSSWGSSSRSGSSRSSWSSPSSSRSSWSSPSSSSSSWSSPSSSSWSSPSSSRSSWSSPSSSSWGSSRRSGSGSSWSSPSSSWSHSPSPSSVFTKGSVIGGSSSKWGSSAPSGSRPAAAYSVAGRSAFTSASNRPLISPVRSSSIHVVPVVTNPGLTVVNNYRSPSYFMSDNSGFFNGYLLGRMMSGSNQYYYDHYYYNSYIPYRYNYRPYDTSVYTTISPPAAAGVATGSISNGVRDWMPTTSTATTAVRPSKNYCSLARWNMELPFSELPNMALSFLINDTVSGSNVSDKSRFMYELLNGTLQMYGNLPVTSDVFQLDTSLNTTQCKFKTPNPNARYAQMPSNDSTVQSASHADSPAKTAMTPIGISNAFFDGPLCDMYRRNKNLSFMPEMPECDQPKVQSSQPMQTEEPFVTSINNALTKYSNISTNLDLLTDLVNSAKACYGDLEQTSSATASLLFPCLDFTLDTTQISSLNNDDSMFGNEDLCSKYLNPSVARCLSAAPLSGTKAMSRRCSVNDLTNLLVFARNFYLCAEPVGNYLLDYAISIQPTTTEQPVRFVPQIVDNSGYDRIHAYRSGDTKVSANSMVPVWTLSIVILLVPAIF